MQAKYECSNWEDSLTGKRKQAYRDHVVKLHAMWDANSDLILAQDRYKYKKRSFYRKQAAYLGNKAYYELWLKHPKQVFDTLYSDALHRWVLNGALKRQNLGSQVCIYLQQDETDAYYISYFVLNDTEENPMLTCNHFFEQNGKLIAKRIGPKPTCEVLDPIRAKLELDFLDDSVVKDQAFLARCLGLAYDYNFKKYVLDGFSDFWDKPRCSLISGLQFVYNLP